MVAQDEAGKTLARRRLPEGADGTARFHGLVASRRGEDGEPDAAQVIVVTETGRGPWPKSPAAAGYRVCPISPRQAARLTAAQVTAALKLAGRRGDHGRPARQFPDREQDLDGR